mgnify:CR=1 FL=1|jgi:hypothetical protein
MTAQTRNRLIVAALALITGLLIWFGPEDELSLPVEKSAKAPAASARPGDNAVSGSRPALKVIERVAVADVPDVFKSFSWYVPPPPPPPPPPAPPPPPTAPPLPFVYLGKYIDGKTQLFILSRGNRVLNVAVGEVIADTYRIDGVQGGDLGITYLPLNIKQSLPVGSD